MRKRNKQKHFKQKLAITFLFLLFSYSLTAQCYKSNLDVGKQQYNSGKYQTALATFEKSLKCPDAKAGAEAKQWITKCKNKIDVQTKNANKKLKIGDNYAGGIIFYLDKTGKHGKVCATKDQSTNAMWDEAKRICLNLTLNGYSDWYLPNKNELNQIYVNLHRKNKGGFAGDFYWSSTEYSSNYAWMQYFGSGTQYYDDKYVAFYVRAVRAF